MRLPLILLLAAGVLQAACQDTNSPSPGDPPAEGTLVISTSTQGDDPDLDGYLLAVDGVDSIVLHPTGHSALDLPPGQHSLRLLGVAAHCSVSPSVSLEVDVPPDGTAPVTFTITCPATGARITITTSGLDVDSDGYGVLVDGAERGPIPSNGTVLTRLDPGSRTITLTGLAPNCRIDGPASRSVSLARAEVVPIHIAVVCTATTGVLGVIVEQSTGYVYAAFEVMVDGAGLFFVGPHHRKYYAPVSAGDHLVSLAPPSHCTLETEPQQVTVNIGELIRDTVEVGFSVACDPPSGRGTLRITAPTSGTIPPSTRYTVLHEVYGYWDYGGTPTYLGDLEPNGTLIATVAPSFGGPYWNLIHLTGVPANCRVSGPNPTDRFTVMLSETIDIEFTVVCSH